MKRWFIVLPDVANPLFRPLNALSNSRVVRHASGRPWIVGRWRNAEMVVAGARGDVLAAVIGCCPITADELSERLGGVRCVADVDQFVHQLPGSFHLIVKFGDQIRVQGSLSAIRPVAYARVGGVTIAADNASVLAALTNAPVNDRLIALYMTHLQLPYPLSELCLWRGVEYLSPDCYLVLDGGGLRIVNWWSAPEPNASLSDGADAVAGTLTEAVMARVETGVMISADLSGGMDSTSLCFIAATQASDMLTVRRLEADPDSDDDRWARLAAAELPEAEHLVLSHDDTPNVYSEPDGVEEDLEYPYRWMRSRGRHSHLAKLLGRRGGQLHFSGHGGDELFGAVPSYLHDLVRSDVKTATNHIFGHRALRRWSRRELMRSLWDRRTFPEWLQASADHLTDPLASTPCLGWSRPIRMPPWATDAAVESVRELLHGVAATTPLPLARSRAQHETVQYVRNCGRAVRQVAALMSNEGVDLAAPYLDDTVINAALAVRLHERMTPSRYKPLLADAMRGIVPAKILDRTTKGDFTADVYIGLKRNRSRLLSLFADSVLVEEGLVDPDALRSAILGTHPNFGTLIPLEPTIACEQWLRVARGRRQTMREEGMMVLPPR